MKERPILFSTAMVQAILDGRKTMTRRVVKSDKAQTKSKFFNETSSLITEHFENWVFYDQYDKDKQGFDTNQISDCDVIKCPYGKQGDRLWVREKWRNTESSECGCEDHCSCCDGKYDYFASSLDKESKWKPSIHMPRIASRILLEITNIRVERLNDISEEDAKAEGLKAITKDRGKTIKYGIPDSDGLPGNDDCGWWWCRWRVNPIEAFQSLWESINGENSWNDNPWVWIVEFEVIKGGAA